MPSARSKNNKAPASAPAATANSHARQSKPSANQRSQSTEELAVHVKLKLDQLQEQVGGKNNDDDDDQASTDSDTLHPPASVAAKRAMRGRNRTTNTANNVDSSSGDMAAMLAQMATQIDSLQKRIAKQEKNKEKVSTNKSTTRTNEKRQSAAGLQKKRERLPVSAKVEEKPERKKAMKRKKSIEEKIDEKDGTFNVPDLPLLLNPEAAAAAAYEDPNQKPKRTRINWGKSPHRERLEKILEDWWNKEGEARKENGDPIYDYRAYAEKVGIPVKTFFKYIHRDPSKRRLIGDGSHGKPRLIDEKGVDLIVKELKSKAHMAHDGISRQEAVDLIVERHGVSSQNASKYLRKFVLPCLMDDGFKMISENEVDLTETDTVEEPPVRQRKRVIVISGVTSGLGRALLSYFYEHGHDVAGCGRRQDEIQSLQLLFPSAQLSVVDVSDDEAVEIWATELCTDENDDRFHNINLVIANAGVSPESTYGSSAWDVPRTDFDNTIDINIKGVSNMIRHFIPRMIHRDQTSSMEGATFVAMSSGLGRSPNAYHTAYCASKWAVEGMIKSVAMSIPDPMCAVPLAPGVVRTGMQNGGKDGHIDEWVKVAGPMILSLDRRDNGKSLSVKGFYSPKYKQSWILSDGTGIPNLGTGGDFF